MKENILKSIVVLPGYVQCFPGKAPLFVKAKLTEQGNDGKKRLSIIGVVGPMSNGTCRGSAGQCTDELLNIVNYAQEWDADMAKKLHGIWNEWHLNDMRAYCEHQKAWDTGKHINVRGLRHTELGGYIELKIKHGDASPKEIETFDMAELAYNASIGIGGLERFPKKEREVAIAAGYLEERDDGQKKAGWVQACQHPDGLLGKACPVCGYKYGSAWLYEEVPDDVIEWLFSLPPAAREPAWV